MSITFSGVPMFIPPKPIPSQIPSDPKEPQPVIGWSLSLKVRVIVNGPLLL